MCSPILDHYASPRVKSDNQRSDFVVSEAAAERDGVETKRLNEQVRRNIDKFPGDFTFQLTPEKFKNLKSQIATSSSGWGGGRRAPLVFTEYGALQAANVLDSKNVAQMSVFIVRSFVRLREMALTNEKLSRKVVQLEKRVSDHDEILIEIVREIRQLIEEKSQKILNSYVIMHLRTKTNFIVKVSCG